MIGVTILGSTGTIGVNTLDVLQRHPDKFRVVALAAYSNHARLLAQCNEFSPEYAVLVDEQAAEQLRAALHKQGSHTQVLQGEAALETVAALPQVQYVMAAIVGAAGLKSSLAAARAGKRILLANKESLVMSGKLFMDAVHDNQAELLPIDSEHNAIFQCMPVHHRDGLDGIGVEKIILTGSGGPFRELALGQLDKVTPAQAVAHPNWVMGRKISVDSATMMNKGLEVIEACWLFNTGLEKIEVLLHPQSVIHSMVRYVDGSVIAQLGQPDMRTPIAHALAWPERITSGVTQLDFMKMDQLSFAPVDTKRYPCLHLACEAMQQGGTATAILNAANEIAVQAFLDEQLAFTGIAATVGHVLENSTHNSQQTLASVLQADAAARVMAQEYIASLRKPTEVSIR